MLNDDRADWREAWALFTDGIAYIWHGALHATNVAESLLAAGLAVRTQFIRAKDPQVLSRSDLWSSRTFTMSCIVEGKYVIYRPVGLPV